MNNDSFYQEFGKMLKGLRLSKDLTQEELAKRVGLSRTSVTNIEKGRQRIHFHFIYVLSSALGVEPSRLLPEKGKLFPYDVLSDEALNISSEDNNLNNDTKDWLIRVLKPRQVDKGEEKNEAEKGRKESEGSI